MLWRRVLYNHIRFPMHRISLLAAVTSREQNWWRVGSTQEWEWEAEEENEEALAKSFCLLLPDGQTEKGTLGFSEKIWINYLVLSLSVLWNLIKIETIRAFLLGGPGKDSQISPHTEVVRGSGSLLGLSHHLALCPIWEQIFGKTQISKQKKYLGRKRGGVYMWRYAIFFSYELKLTEDLVGIRRCHPVSIIISA